MSAPYLLRDDADGVVTLTMNRPDQFNPLSEAMLSAFETEITAIAEDESIRCVVIAAEGRAFCAGHDLKEMRGTPELAYYQTLFARCSAFMQSLIALPVPVIARVQGLATAAGCQLVATCDMAVSVDTAKFGVSGVNLGLFCSTPSVALSRVVSRKRAFEMLVTGDFISAKTAEDWGLVNRAVPADVLDAEVARITDNLRGKSPVPIQMGKALFQRQLGLDLAEAYVDAGETMAQNMMTHDAVEGIDAFIQKRDPKWRGE